MHRALVQGTVVLVTVVVGWMVDVLLVVEVLEVVVVDGRVVVVELVEVVLLEVDVLLVVLVVGA